MSKSEIYNTLRKMTLEELASMFCCSEEKAVVNENMNISNKAERKVLYTVNELIEKYPFFTRYNINKAIQNDGLPYCFIGNKRMFDKEEIDKWLEKETKPKKEKIKYDI